MPRADFKLAGIPQDYETPGTTCHLTRKLMRGLFDEGYRGGRDGTAWRSFPPGLEKDIDRHAKKRHSVRHRPWSASSDSWTPDKIRITLGDGDTANTYSDTAASLSDQGSDRVVPRPRHE